jgi:hypothetical protein
MSLSLFEGTCAVCGGATAAMADGAYLCDDCFIADGRPDAEPAERGEVSVRAFSFGGGVQSVAALVLAATGRIQYDTFLFSNVGDDSEYPETMAYLRDWAIPYAEAHGLRLLTLYKTRRDGSTETLYEKLHRTPRSIDIPVRMYNGAPGNRSCTADFKIKVVAKWMRANGATKENPGMVGIGISLDEHTRAKGSQLPHIINDYPMVGMGITRQDCERIIQEAGLPVPPKSSCFFCPFHHITVWQDLFDKHPELFAKSVALEKMLNERRAALGLRPVWLTSRARPLDEVITGSHRDQLAIFTDPNEGRYSCGPFTCDGTGGSDDPGDPFAGLVVKGGPTAA